MERESMFLCRVSEEPLRISEAEAFCNDPGGGGIAFFSGIVRNKNNDKEVLRLEYEAYAPMAEKEMRMLAEEVAERWPVLKAAVLHRIGRLQIGDTAVIIAVQTVHRAEAFEACRFLIDNLKERVPIWKREVYADGEEWLNARP